MNLRGFILISALLAMTGLASCAITRSRPCSKSGDTTWYPPISGNMQCYQTKAPNGDMINQGQFHQYYPSGQLALEGKFQSGKKNGLWIQYDEKGNRIAERYFENGVERSQPRKP
jgi:hypothetical protein